MTAKSKLENPRNTNNRDSDDLTAIKGIGPARQRWLKESLGVDTYRNLAALSVDEIESQLKAEGQIFSRKEIKRWIAGAQELAAVELTSQQVRETTEVEAEAIPESPFSAAEWNSIAAFIVHLQLREIEGEEIDQRITVQHIPVAENGTWLEDDIEEKPTEIEGERQGERLYQWIQAQVVEKMPELPTPGEKTRVMAPTVALPPQEELSVTVDITQFRVIQPPQAEMSLGIGGGEKLFSGFITADQPVNFEVSFKLTGAAAPDTTLKEQEFRVRCYAYNRSTGERLHLGDSPPDFLVKTKLDYTITLAEVKLPSGMYRLHVIAELLGSPRIFGYFEVPMLQVMGVSVPHSDLAPLPQVL